jgi:hypothetical protein
LLLLLVLVLVLVWYLEKGIVCGAGGSTGGRCVVVLLEGLFGGECVDGLA